MNTPIDEADEVAGGTESPDFPTVAAIQTNQADTDAFVVKLRIESAPCCQLPGDVNHDGQVDLMDLEYLRYFIHQDGPAPPCEGNADVNGDGVVDREDLTCFTRFLFSQGNPCVFSECL